MNPEARNATDLSTAVIQRFLRSADEDGIGATVRQRLEKTLLAAERPTRKALEDALFAEEILP